MCSGRMGQDGKGKGGRGGDNDRGGGRGLCPASLKSISASQQANEGSKY